MATYQGHNEDASGNILLNIGNGMTATVELGSTASQAYTKGAYLFFNNRFCKATSAIASGTTLAIGTNLSETTIGTELTSHLRSSDGKEFYFDVKDGSYGYYPSASKTASEFVPFGGTSTLIGTYAYANSGASTLGLTADQTKNINTITYKFDIGANYGGQYFVYDETSGTFLLAATSFSSTTATATVTLGSSKGHLIRASSNSGGGTNARVTITNIT